MSDSSKNSTDAGTAYQVLARKYRPQNFDDLLGHEAMVRTLRNAFAANRIAHAYILTGVRGVGKTTTARILARALNYEVPGKIDQPTIEMDEEGIHCRAIAEGSHQDVIEMDAASRTGIGDIRELIEAVRYAPVEARYKVYIIDEVHMLSTSAFNALLKTLEEPPPHVKFIFATTEIRKVPVTVLSRCQRFDLKRFDIETLCTYLEGICEKEKSKVAPEGLAMIARAAEGSVRDALSLLDQALIQAPVDDGTISADTVRDMLGLVDRATSWEMLSAALQGNAPEALARFRGQYDAGGDPGMILKDLLEIIHLLTRIKVAGEAAASQGLAGEADRDRALELAQSLSMAALTRAWNLLMKGHKEVLGSPDAAASGEMALIALSYAADLPTPDEALRLLKEGKLKAAPATEASATSAPSAQEAKMSEASTKGPAVGGEMKFEQGHGSDQVTQKRSANASAAVRPETAPVAGPVFKDLQDIASHASAMGDAKLCMEIETMMRLVKFEPQAIEFNPTDQAPADLAGRLAQQLKAWTGKRWVVTVNARETGASTLRSVRQTKVLNHPLVQAALSAFPDIDVHRDMRISTVKTLSDPSIEDGSELDET